MSQGSLFTVREPLAASCGVGVDSVAGLVGYRQRGIVPDLIMFANTKSEKPETYEYRDKVLIPWLRAIGFPDLVEVCLGVVHGEHGDYDGLEQNCLVNETVPGEALGNGGCTLKHKVAPMDMYVRHWAPAIEARAAGGAVRRAIFYDAGPADAKRGLKGVKPSKGDRFEYPLRQWGWDREECIRQILSDPELVAIATAAGIDPIPPKSACFFCPNNTPAELADIDDKHHDLGNRIMDMEWGAIHSPRHPLRVIAGLWRQEILGFRDAEPHPGTMTEYILARRHAKRTEGKRVLPIYGQTYWKPSTKPAEAAAKRAAKLAAKEAKRRSTADTCGGCEC